MYTYLRRTFSGFSLLELLVVIFIIAIFSSIVMIHGISHRTLHETDDFAGALKIRIQTAHDQSVTQLTTLGLWIHRSNYEFFQYNKGSENNWVRLNIQDNFWKSIAIPPDIHLTLSVLKPVSSPHDFHASPFSPQIIFMPNGDFTDFILTVNNTNSGRRIQIKGESDNGITMQVIP